MIPDTSTSRPACFSLRNTSDEEQPPRSRLLFQGLDTGHSIHGTTLEYQCLFSDVYLIATSYACPYEELIHFYLFTADLLLVASKTLGGMYCPGVFTEPSHHDNQVFFSFGQRSWRLSIRRRAIWKSLFGFKRWTILIEESEME